jgi:hypothetical protein
MYIAFKAGEKIVEQKKLTKKEQELEEAMLWVRRQNAINKKKALKHFEKEIDALCVKNPGFRGKLNH